MALYGAVPLYSVLDGERKATMVVVNGDDRDGDGEHQRMIGSIGLLSSSE
jgi:hypothetical protein